jgi:glycosyltransferase involved in cell wall biosynthesis
LAAKLDTNVGDSLLTIVVPVHNMSGRLGNLSKWLDDAHSLNVKVVLVHDKSEDSTGSELLELLQSKNSRHFSLLETNSQSPGLARNYGLEIVDTPWFSFADSDDLVYVSSVLKLIDETKSSNCDLGVGSFISNDLRSGKETVVQSPALKEDALPLHLAKKMGLWRLVFSTSSFGDIRFTDHKMGEDYLFANLVLNRTSRIFVGSEIVYKYFYGGILNLTSNRSVMIDMIGVLKLIKSIKPVKNSATAFRVFSIQKLTLSLLKNSGNREKIGAKTLMMISLISHPIYLFKLFFSLKSNGRG